MTDQQIAQGAGLTPRSITVQGSEQLLPKLAFASYDGTGAAGNYLPVVKLIGPGGELAGQAVGDQVTAGASVDQTWFRGLAKPAAGTAVGTVPIGWQSLTIRHGFNGIFTSAASLFAAPLPTPGDGLNACYALWKVQAGDTLELAVLNLVATSYDFYINTTYIQDVLGGAQETLNSGALTTVPFGGALLPFGAKQSGSSLLNLGTPTSPSFVNAGTYFVVATSQGPA